MKKLGVNKISNSPTDHGFQAVKLDEKEWPGIRGGVLGHVAVTVRTRTIPGTLGLSVTLE